MPTLALLLVDPLHCGQPVTSQAKAAEALASLDYPPVGAVTLSYPLSAIRDDRKKPDGSVPGFGQLHPRTQVRSMAQEVCLLA